MEYRPLGQTGLTVSALSFGASSMGGVFKPVAEADAIRTCRTALDSGINLIDVSPFYGQTRAETVLGRALVGVPRESYLLATKVGRYGHDAFDFSAATVTAEFEASLARLGVDEVDILQCHDIEFGSLEQVANETLPALERLREQGKVRFIGFTGLPLSIFERLLPAVEVDLILSYCHYCLNDTSLLELLPLCERRGVGVVNASPLAMGLLTPQGPPAWHPAPEALVTACRQAAALCSARGASLVKLAVQYSLAEPRIASTLVSSANPANIAQNIAWAAEPLDDDLLAAVLAVLAPVHNLTWPSGRPENN